MTTIAELRKMLEAAPPLPWAIEDWREHADFIVAWLNQAPSLLDALEAAEELRETADDPRIPAAVLRSKILTFDAAKKGIDDDAK